MNMRHYEMMNTTEKQASQTFFRVLFVFRPAEEFSLPLIFNTISLLLSFGKPYLESSMFNIKETYKSSQDKSDGSCDDELTVIWMFKNRRAEELIAFLQVASSTFTLLYSAS